MAVEFGTITVTSDGQPTSTSQAWNAENNVYITSDNKYIVVDGIKFEIYSPEPKRDLSLVLQEEWYDVDSWECEKVEFDAARALLDIVAGTLGVSDIELADGVNGYPKTKTGTKLYKERNGMLAGLQIVSNILQAIANAIEYTYVKFTFQISDLKNYRVTIIGGTKSDALKYNNYSAYNYRRSFLSDVATNIFYYDSKEGLKTTVLSTINETVKSINNNNSFAKLLVSEDNLKLKDDEYYDIELYLNAKRRNQSYQVFIYTDLNQCISQKFITYEKEGLYLVKKIPGAVFGIVKNTEDLIEMMDDLIIRNINTDFSNAFWQLCEQVLVDYNKSQNIPDFSNATKAPMSQLCEIEWEKHQKK